MSGTAGDLTHRRIDELPQLWDGFAKMVRAGLGISSFGVQIMDLPPNYATRFHDETETGQEEMYLALRGSGAIVLHDQDGPRLTLDAEHVARIGPAVMRGLASGPEGMRVLCVGGVPGAAFEAQEWTEQGEPPG